MQIGGHRSESLTEAISVEDCAWTEAVQVVPAEAALLVKSAETAVLFLIVVSSVPVAPDSGRRSSSHAKGFRRPS